MLPCPARTQVLGAASGGCQELPPPLQRRGFLPCSTYSNRTVASARNFLSKSQRKNTSKLWGKGVGREEKQSEAAAYGHRHANVWKLV